MNLWAPGCSLLQISSYHRKKKYINRLNQNTMKNQGSLAVSALKPGPQFLCPSVCFSYLEYLARTVQCFQLALFYLLCITRVLTNHINFRMYANHFLWGQASCLFYIWESSRCVPKVPSASAHSTIILVKPTLLKVANTDKVHECTEKKKQQC